MQIICEILCLGQQLQHGDSANLTGYIREI